MSSAPFVVERLAVPGADYAAGVADGTVVLMGERHTRYKRHQQDRKLTYPSSCPTDRDHLNHLTHMRALGAGGALRRLARWPKRAYRTVAPELREPPRVCPPPSGCYHSVRTARRYGRQRQT